MYRFPFGNLQKCHHLRKTEIFWKSGFAECFGNLRKSGKICGNISNVRICRKLRKYAEMCENLWKSKMFENLRNLRKDLPQSAEMIRSFCKVSKNFHFKKNNAVTLQNGGSFSYVSRDQHQSLQVNTNFSAFFEIYKIVTPSHPSTLKISTKFHQTFSHFCKIVKWFSAKPLFF